MGKVEEEILDNVTKGAGLLSDNNIIQKVLQITSDTLIVLDNNYRCVDLLLKTDNPILNERKDIVGEDFLKILPLETAKLLKRELQYTRETGVTSNVNYDLPLDDKMYYFKMIIHKFDDDHLLCQYRDITKRSNMKGRLKSSAKALLEVGKVAQIVQWSYNLDDRELLYPAYSSLEDSISLNPEIFPLALYLEAIYEEDRVLVENFLNTRSKNSVTIEYRVGQVGAPFQYMRSTKYAQVDDHLINGFTQNVTDFMKHRHELEMLVSVIRKAPYSVMAAKNDGEIIFINQSGLRMSGVLAHQEMESLNVMNLIEELSTPDKWLTFKENLKSSNGGFHFRTKNSFAGLDSIEMDCSSTLENWGGEEIIWFFQHDISDQVRYQEQLLKSKEAAEESEKLKIAFICNMNHEIRTPLSAIIGLSMLIAETEEADLRHEYSKLITSNSDQLLRLITDLLEMSKLDAGSMSLVPVRESLNNILQEINVCFAHVEHEAKLHVIIPDNDTYAWIDKGRMMQLLTNMINNSRKFTPPSGFIEVGYLIDGDSIVWTVKDNGIGIPIEKQNEVFNRFFKVNCNDVGSGLGLSICKSIVDQMEGRIEVDSEEGKGTEFRIYTPLIVDGRH